MDLATENQQLRTRLLSAAGDDLCRLTPEEIKAYTSGAVKIPPKAEFISSCERFHAQIAKEAGVMENCLTLAQLIAENERLRVELAEWHPMTNEEAQKAYEEAEAVPLSEERIQAIMTAALDPATRIPNSEQAQMVAEIRRLRGKLNEMVERLRELANTTTGYIVVGELRSILAEL